MQSQDPDQYKNLILAVILSMAVLLAWQYFYAGPQEARRRAQEQSQQQATPSATTPQPGWVCERECESSVSSAWASMPLASAALTAVVTMLLPITHDSLTPPRVFT